MREKEHIKGLVFSAKQTMETILRNSANNRLSDKECPVCGSPLIDGICQDYGDNNCMYRED